MKNQKATQMAEAAVREEIRKGNLNKTNDILAMLPDVIDTVHIDHRELRNSIEKCLYSKNPLNSLLNLFGVQFIMKEKTINNLIESGFDADTAYAESGKAQSKPWLTLNPEKTKSVIENFARELSYLESETTSAYEDEKKRSNDLFDKYEALMKEHNKLKITVESTEKMIAERIQYILSLNGEAAEGNEQLIELFRDMNIDVYWNCNDTSLTDEEMFTEYSIDNVPEANIKPCLVRNGSVYIKGTRIVKK